MEEVLAPLHRKGASFRLILALFRVALDADRDNLTRARAAERLPR